ncbi:aminotransferase class V-fold PLP-dependent enzyme [Falsirhodobacter sp. 1013]|uniref:aminotransferase class V-fold PLP-dependent enzyme n=1 Tax=Falsirhodobacter sp. 1013 TaxID=3417566 RepID=UPI003EC100CB
MTALTDFRDSLRRDDILDHLRQGLIGDGVPFETPFGTQRLLYADYVASGRALRQVEAFVAEQVLPFYANSHTEASFCGMTMTRMREEGRAAIARLVDAGDGCHVVFTGSGATSGINRIVNLLRVSERVRAGERVVVICGPYEHHSNILPWRETGAEMVEVAEAETGGVNMDDLSRALKAADGADLVIGTFSAASNVTGILTDTEAVTAALKAAGALAIWDYAGGGPYLPMSMQGKDAIVFSAHKFAGGPGASGVLVLRDTVVQRATPTQPGGGSVSFVSPRSHAYSARVTAREEAGTPNVVGDIRAALVMLVKDAVGTDRIHHREQELRARALRVWDAVPQMEVLGRRAPALPIFSFRIREGGGGYVHHQLFTRMLSDMTGIQARGGCACAGPYAHRLMGIDDTASEALFARLQAGEELAKPGWVRLNLSWLHSDVQADRIIAAVANLVANAAELSARYIGDPVTARFRVADMAAE